MRISFMSVCKKRFRTALPKDPVPPVINRVLFKKSPIGLSTSLEFFPDSPHVNSVDDVV